MNDQAAKLRRKVEITNNPKQAKTIAIVSGKGGVGKSNIAVNFSLELINHGKKVILFDLDIGMGNINILLGLQPKKSIVDLFNEDLSVHDIIEQGPNGLSYVAGGSGLSGFLQFDESKKNYFFDQYNELTEMYDFIIFDMGAGATIDSLFFILASDECIVVTTPEPTAITDAYSMIKQIVHQGGEMPIQIILNRSTSQKEGLLALERFQQVVYQFLHIHTKVLGIMPDDKTVTQAVIHQTPYMILNGKSHVAKSMRKLTENYVALSSDNNSKETKSFIEKFKKLLRGKI